MSGPTKKDLVLQSANNNLYKLIDAKKDAMPQGFNKTRFMQNCMTVLNDTYNIEKCEPLSVARTMLKGAFLGLDFFMKECYAIPYGTELNFQTDYKGEVKLVRKYAVRPIKDIYAKLVREGDQFEESIANGEQTVNFIPLVFNDNPIQGAFAVVVYQDGGMEYETMSTAEIEHIKESFSQKSFKTKEFSKAWVKTPGEMYKKTILRRLTKRISKEFDSIEQSKEFDRASGMNFEEDKKKVVEVPNTFVKTEEPVVDAEFTEIVETVTEPVEGFQAIEGDTPFDGGKTNE